MDNGLGTWTTLLCTLAFVNTVASARPPADFFEVMPVTPSRVIKHEVEIQGQFDDELAEIYVNGPSMFSQAVGVGEGAVQEPRAYLNWYQIDEPGKEPRRTLSVRTSLQGNDAQQITIGNSAFLLSPAQRLTTGSPSAMPEGLDYFKAYKIIGDSATQQKVKLNGAFGPASRTVTRAVYFCVPVEQRHHDERSLIKNAQNFMLVYELTPHKHDARVSTMDLFGLNKLEVRSSNWLCVNATIVEPTPEDSD